MYRILWIVALFILILPLVWKIVMRIFLKIDNKLNSAEIDADELNEKKKSLVEDLSNRKKKAEDEASNAEKAIEKLK